MNMRVVKDNLPYITNLLRSTDSGVGTDREKSEKADKRKVQTHMSSLLVTSETCQSHENQLELRS